MIFDSNDRDASMFRKNAQEWWLPLASSIQLVESKIKDTAHYKAAGINEEHISNLAIVRLLVIPEATLYVKESDEFENRKRKNAEAKECIDRNCDDNATLVCNCKKMKDVSLIDEEEVKHFSRMLKDSNFHKHQRR